MKKALCIGLIAGLSLASCTSQTFLSEAQYAQLETAQKITFHATRANPTNMDVINIANNLPGLRGNQLFQLSEGNMLELGPSQLRVYLPYFGQINTARNLYGSRNTGFDFSTSDFQVQRQNTSDRKVYLIQVNDSKNPGLQMRLEVFPNGRAYLGMLSMDKMAISYEGYLSIP